MFYKYIYFFFLFKKNSRRNISSSYLLTNQSKPNSQSTTNKCDIKSFLLLYYKMSFHSSSLFKIYFLINNYVLTYVYCNALHYKMNIQKENSKNFNKLLLHYFSTIYIKALFINKTCIMIYIKCST